MIIDNTRSRILVVDDEPSIGRALTIALTRAGYEVRAVEAGEVALALLRAEPFDCLVVDYRMPDLRGDALFELAAAHQPGLRTRTVFTTGDVTARAHEMLAACGCPVLQKPFDLAELLAVVGRLSRRWQTVSA